MDPWTSGDQILAFNGKPIGKVRVAGLPEVERLLNAPKGTRISFPYLTFTALEDSTARWFVEWDNEPRGGSVYRDLLIRDNGRRALFTLQRAWIKGHHGRAEEGCRVVIQDASVERLTTGMPDSSLGIG